MTHRSRKFETLIYSTAGIALAAVLFLVVNILAGSAPVRLDITQDRLYTLSEGTRQVLKNIEAPVSVRFYVTQSEANMPVFLRNYAVQIEDLLREYQEAADGMIVVEKLDPRPDTDAEDSARIDGVQGQSIDLTTQIYMGLSFTCLDRKVAIPFMSPDRENLLEYDITRALSQVIAPTELRIGVMSPLQVLGSQQNMMMMMGQPQNQKAWIAMEELRRDYQVTEVPMGSESIPENINLLIVIHPTGISEKTEFAIDQYLLRGGKLIVCVDPVSIFQSANNAQGPFAGASGSTMPTLFPKWGITYDSSKVLMDPVYGTEINQEGRPMMHGAVLSLIGESIGKDDAATSRLDNMLMAMAGGLTLDTPAHLTSTVLLQSSPSAGVVDAFEARFSPDKAIDNRVQKGGSYPLAVRLKGKFQTAFPNGLAGQTNDAALKEATGEGVAVVLADSDLFADNFAVRVQNMFGQVVVVPQNGNLAFLQNAVEQLSGDASLIDMRSRASRSRPFTVIREMERQAEDKFKAEIKELETRVEETNRKLQEMQRLKSESEQLMLSPEQQAAIASFQKEETDTKRRLRDLRKDLRRNIDALVFRIKTANILVMPLVVILVGIAVAVIRSRQRKVNS